MPLRAPGQNAQHCSPLCPIFIQAKNTFYPRSRNEMERDVIELLSTVKKSKLNLDTINSLAEEPVISLITPRHVKKTEKKFTPNKYPDEDLIEVIEDKENIQSTNAILKSLFKDVHKSNENCSKSMEISLNIDIESVENNACELTSTSKAKSSMLKPLISMASAASTVKITHKTQTNIQKITLNNSNPNLPAKKSNTAKLRKKKSSKVSKKQSEKLVAKQMLAARKINDGKFIHLELDVHWRVSPWFEYLSSRIQQHLCDEHEIKTTSVTRANGDICTVIFARKHYQWISEDHLSVKVSESDLKVPLLALNKEPTPLNLVLLFHDPNDFLLKLYLDKQNQAKFKKNINSSENSENQRYSNLMNTYKLTLTEVNLHKTKKIIILSNIFDILAKSNIHCLTRSDVKEACLFLLLKFGFDTLITNSDKETVNKVSSLIIAAGKRCYDIRRNNVDMGRNIKNRILTEAKDRGLSDREIEKEIWINQLRTFTLVSENKAREISKVFPTIHSLMKFIEKSSDEKSVELLAAELKKTKIKRTEKKLCSVLINFFNEKFT